MNKQKQKQEIDNWVRDLRAKGYTVEKIDDLPECDEMGVAKGTSTFACALIVAGAIFGIIATALCNLIF